MAMRERIHIEEPIHSPTDSYGKWTVLDWLPLAEETAFAATWEHVGGTETFRGRQLQPNVLGVFTIRDPRIEIKPEYRVKHLNDNDKIYEIHSVRPFEGNLEGGFKLIDIYVKGLDL
jgi:hypothetical protein